MDKQVAMYLRDLAKNQQLLAEFIDVLLIAYGPDYKAKLTQVQEGQHYLYRELDELYNSL